MIGRVQDLPKEFFSGDAADNLMVFDGECVLCSTFFRFKLRHDSAQKFQFATAQSPLGQALYAALSLSIDDFDTNLVIVDGEIHGHLDAFATAMSVLDWPWRTLTALRWLPRKIKMPLYRLIARNRYRLFGRYDQCMIPDVALRARFSSGGV